MEFGVVAGSSRGVVVEQRAERTHEEMADFVCTIEEAVCICGLWGVGWC